MPVYDLADYLGMPQQAPADPLFYQNQRKASIDREAADFNQRAGARDQLYRLQRQAPVLQAQQAQNAYDEVAQQANDLRMKQEIEAQVERAASELAGGNLNPESDDFAVKYRDLATRNPLAMSDPRFRQVAGLYEGQNQSYRQTRAAQVEAERSFATKEAEGLRTAIGDYLESGGAAEKAQGIKSIEEAKYLKGQLPKPGRSGAGGISADERRLKNILDARDNQLKRYEKKVEEGELEPMDAKYLAAVDAWEKANEAYVGMNQSGVAPVATAQSEQQQINPSAAAARSALTGMASVATPFAPAAFPSAALANALPQAPVAAAKAPQTDTPTIPDDGTSEFRAIIANPDVPEVDRNVAFTELKTLLESQTPPKGSTFTEIAKFNNDLKERIDSARVDLEANRFREMVAPVWTREKDIVAKAIKRMAQDLGAEEDTVIASLFPRDKNGKPAEQQKIPMSIVPKEMQPMKRDKFGEREMYVKDLLAAYLADQRGKNPADASYEGISKAKIEDLSGWMKSADEGDYPDKEVYKKALRKVGLDADRTQEDVIREYVKSMALPVATASPQVNVAPKAVKTSTGNTATLKSSQ